MGRVIYDLAHPDDAVSFRQNLEEAIREGCSMSPVLKLRIPGEKYLQVSPVADKGLITVISCV